MSIYHCDWCDLLHDNDWVPCVEDPRDPLATICEDGLAEIKEQREAAQVQFEIACQSYIKELDSSYAVLTRSHLTLRQLYNLYSPGRVQEYLENYWEERKNGEKT